MFLDFILSLKHCGFLKLVLVDMTIVCVNLNQVDAVTA